MKVSFEEILFNDRFDIIDKVFYISGNEETLIKKLEKQLIDRFYKLGIRHVERLDSIEEYKENSDLFFEKNLVILDGIKGIKIEKIKNFHKNKNLIIVSENSRGDKMLKSAFEKEKMFVLVNCYALNIDQKIKILRSLTKKHSINIEKDAISYILENTANRYVFFENEIQKIIGLNKNNYSTKDIRKTLSSQVNEDYYRLFFSILKKNSDLIFLYNLTISNLSDLYKLLQVTKFCFEIIFKSKNITDLEKSVPMYMFKEKNNFIKIYNRIDQNKKKTVYMLIYKSENLIRKNSSLYFSIGNRFLLNLKKNI